MTTRSVEIKYLLANVLEYLIRYIAAADEETQRHQEHAEVEATSVRKFLPAIGQPPSYQRIPHSKFQVPEQARGSVGIISCLEAILNDSVNTFAPGFLDKLYAAPCPPGIAAELILSVLNTNVHVYNVAPALSWIEKNTTEALAKRFGFSDKDSGGISVQGGSSANLTSLVVARNTLHPHTKVHGNSYGASKLLIFTSVHGHYSIAQAAQICGLGTDGVIPVPVDPDSGAMVATELENLVTEAEAAGQTPFFVNATAGTTVLGSFDPLEEIATIAKKHGMWLHVDAAWGGGFIFSKSLQDRLQGSHLADSIAFNPHKMLGIPLTCSFLLARNLSNFHRSNTISAPYLFHDNDDGEEKQWGSPQDLAELTLQCGRRGDSLKLFLSWQYYGSDGFGLQVDHAYSVACYLANLVESNPHTTLVSAKRPPCLQVCFYFTPHGKPAIGQPISLPTPLSTRSFNFPSAATGVAEMLHEPKCWGEENSRITHRIVDSLGSRGFMIDYAPALEGKEHLGAFFRAVVNRTTSKETAERLLSDLVETGMRHCESLLENAP